jgi:outer membrane protein TolC
MKPRFIVWVGVGLCCCLVYAEPLPQPLTLQYALQLAEELHPDLKAQLAELELARANSQQVAAQLGFDARFIADGRWVEPSTDEGREFGGDSRFTSHNDSRFHLTLSKPLYDFGQSEAKIAAAEALKEVEELQLQALKGRRRLQIMRSYFEVLLADLAFAEADEAMAIAYVRLDRMRDRNELKQVSDVQLAEQNHRYQLKRLTRYKAQARQRTTRARLSEVLNRPRELPAELVPPVLAVTDRSLPDLDQWIKQALQSNPTLVALRAEAEASREKLRAARFGNRPTLSGELTASEYAREFATRDKYRAGVVLEVPLYTGGRVDAGRSEALAGMRQVEARLEQTESEIRQALIEAWERLQVLQAQRDQALVELEFRDLDLDQARTLYELEATADLGDAMADFSGARLRRVQAEYQIALTWAEVALLTGDSGWDPLLAP